MLILSGHKKWVEDRSPWLNTEDYDGRTIAVHMTLYARSCCTYEESQARPGHLLREMLITS